MKPDTSPDRSHDCPILHVDMDAFFASVAIRDRPELAEVPVIVGGGHRGVVLAANYPARKYGVHSALPMTRARRMCPDAVVLSPDYADFDGVSSSVMEIFRQVTPLVEAVSLDEAFLDVSGATRRLGSPLSIAEHIRARVADEQRITCSVGVAGTVSVAKLASRRAKPDGVLVVPPREVTRFLHPLDVGELCGVGEKTREQLHRLGLRTVGDIAHTPLATLQRGIGMAVGSQLHHLAWGTDRRTITPRRGNHEPDKSMGADETFGRDTDDRAVVLRELLRLSAKVTRRMRTAGVAGRTVTLEGALRRLHHHHPVPHAGRRDRRHQRGPCDRGRAVRRVGPATSPDPPGGRTGRGAGARATRCSASSSSGLATGAGRRPTGPPTLRHCGSGVAPYAEPRC